MSLNSPKRRILLADADAALRGTLREALQREGHEVAEAPTAGRLRELMAERPVDVVILDLDLPDENGLMVVRDLRAASGVGIVVQSERDEAIDRIVALEMGADHVMPKGRDAREIAVRVRNLLWRMGAAGSQAAGRAHDQFRFADYLFDVSKRVLRDTAGGTSTLTRQETAVLHALVTHSGQVMSRDQLMDSVHREWNPTDRTIDVLIGRLRRKIERDPAEPDLIVTIYGEGYLFTGTVLP